MRDSTGAVMRGLREGLRCWGRWLPGSGVVRAVYERDSYVRRERAAWLRQLGPDGRRELRRLYREAMGC